MRVVAVHQDAIVVTSRMWQTNAVLLRGARRTAADDGPEDPGDRGAISLPVAGSATAPRGPDRPPAEAMLIDSPYFPDELEALSALARESEFPVVALLATHGDFDHLLGRLAFPELALGVAETTAERLRAEPTAPGRQLGKADTEHYVRRDAEVRVEDIQQLPVPGRLELGDEELELHPASGHTGEGMAILARHARLLVCGDYLSDVEIPMVSEGGSLAAYRDTLARLAPLVAEVDRIVPGHGSPLERERALRVLDEDVDYLEALEAGEERPALPPDRDTRRQVAIHRENLRRTG